ncbi:hypothetical protein XENORESO_017211 [Xenotaenia resolanae]|uniref:Uncharacterized protein n=1 Tax=Xenotaenia resolanae TaxID=208358 RepID=A0ABV0WFJ7_9TELE
MISFSFSEGSGGRSLSCNWWVAGSNPRPVCLSHCVLGQDTSPSLPADGGQRTRWSRLYGSLASVSLPQGSCSYTASLPRTMCDWVDDWVDDWAFWGLWGLDKTQASKFSSPQLKLQNKLVTKVFTLQDGA